VQAAPKPEEATVVDVDDAIVADAAGKPPPDEATQVRYPLSQPYMDGR